MSGESEQGKPSDDILYSVTHHEGGGMTLVFFGRLNGREAGLEAEMAVSVELPSEMADRLAEELRSRSR
ncbi:MAG: hypothetical protein ABW250_22515 [Pyrinomonadaceae bacterium]